MPLVDWCCWSNVNLIAVVAVSTDVALHAIAKSHNVLSLAGPRYSAITRQMSRYNTIGAHDLITSLDRCDGRQWC